MSDVQPVDQPGRPNQLYWYDDLAEELYDILQESGDTGLTIAEIAAELEVPVHVARLTIRHMRKAFAEMYDINVIWKPVGRERRYILTKELSEAAPRLESRLRMFGSNLQTEIRLLKSLSANYDRATEEGQDIFHLLKVMRRLEEDVEEMLDRRANAG